MTTSNKNPREGMVREKMDEEIYCSMGGNLQTQEAKSRQSGLLGHH